MAIALANQSSGLIGTAANSWNYTLGFTPTVGRQIVVFTLTPQASGANAYCWAVSGPTSNFACVGTRSGVTGSYNISAWVGTVNSTSTNIGMFFGSTAVHGIIVAEFSGWTNLSAFASLTNTTTFTSGTPFSGLAATGGRDLAVTGTNALQIRSVLSFNPSTVVNLTPTATGAVSDISVSGTPAATMTSAPGGSTWFTYPNALSSVTGTSLASTTANWNTGPSGGQQAAFTMATGSLLNGQTAGWTQLTNPTGVTSTLVRICYKLGTSLNNTTNTITSSASSTMNAGSIILGEKSLVTSTSSSTENFIVTDNPKEYKFIARTLTYYPGTGWVYDNYPVAGDSSFYVQSLSSVVANATHVLFTNGVTSTIVPVSYQVIDQAGDGYQVTLNGVIPTVGVQTTFISAQFIDLPMLMMNLARSSSDAISFSDENGIKRNVFPSETLAFNYVYGSIEFTSDPSAFIQEVQRTYNGSLENYATSGQPYFSLISDNSDWATPGMQVVFASFDGSIVGPVSILYSDPIYTLDPYTVFGYYVHLEDVIPTGSQSDSYFQRAYLVPSTVVLQDFVDAMSVVPQIVGVPDLDDGSSAPFLGGLV